MAEERKLPEINPDEAIAKLDQGLETCRSVVADYRAALINSADQPGSIANDQEPPMAERLSTEGRTSAREKKWWTH